MKQTRRSPQNLLLFVALAVFSFEPVTFGQKDQDHKAELVVQTGHADIVTAMAFSLDGRLVLTGSKDRTACVWDFETRREIRKFRNHPERVSAVAFSPDGRQALTASLRNIYLWDISTGRLVKNFRTSDLSSEIKSAVFSPDGAYIAGASDCGRSVYLWDVVKSSENPLWINSNYSHNVAFSSDGKSLVAIGCDNTKAAVLDSASGRAFSEVQIKTTERNLETLERVFFSPDDQKIIGASSLGNVKIWDRASGIELLSLPHKEPITAMKISDDRKRLYVTGNENISAWDLKAAAGNQLSGQLVSREKLLADERQGNHLSIASFSPNSQFVVASSGAFRNDYRMDYRTYIWDLKRNARLGYLEGLSAEPYSGAFSANGELLLLNGSDSSIYTKQSNFISLLDLRTGQFLKQLTGHSHAIYSASFSTDSTRILTSGFDGQVILWDLLSGKPISRISVNSRYPVAALSPDNKLIAVGDGTGQVSLWEAASGKQVSLLARPVVRSPVFAYIVSLSFSPDGKKILIGTVDRGIAVFDLSSGRQIDIPFIPSPGGATRPQIGSNGQDMTHYNEWLEAACFSPDGRSVLTADKKGSVKIWDISISPRLIRQIENAESVSAVSFSPDGNFVLTGNGDRHSWTSQTSGIARIWKRDTGELLVELKGHQGDISSAAFSPDGKHVLTTGWDSTYRLWDVKNGSEICKMVSLRDGGWIVIDQDGRFDVNSISGQSGIYWSYGTEIIEFLQLKDRYYEPGLLAKVIKGLPIRQVNQFNNVKLFPRFTYEPPQPGSTAVTINLSNRGGGIGRVRVLVNGKEVVADARQSIRNFNPHASQAQLTADLGNAPLKTGETNLIEVIVWNAEGYLSSRSVQREWNNAVQARSGRRVGEVPSATTTKPPELYAIVGGVSTYSSDSINLRYSAKDAEDVAQALQLGAKRLFGADKVHLTLLSTSGKPGAIAPTKENFQKAFEAARKAKPEDILVVYLAGHGVALRLTGDDDLYCYLTQEARTTNLADPEVRKASSVSSDEMVEWIKQIPALKQVMILDTCAAGAALTKLTESRNPSGEQIRALDRLKDRTGFHVLMGSAADKVSYEASQFGQGLLTYALLEGMKGAALRQDEFIDVNELFKHAVERVPQLARSIGLYSIQQPIPATPRGGASFDIGQMKREDKEAVSLAVAAPLILRPRLLNPDEGFDNLELESAVRRKLDEQSWGTTQRGQPSTAVIVYVDADELPAGLRPSGTYRVTGDRVTVTINLIRNRQRVISFDVEGAKSDPAGLAAEIVRRITQSANRSQ